MSFELTRVEAPTMREALEKIRATLGTDAMIVSTRKFRRGGVLGVGGQEVVEVFAADTRSRIENVQRERSNRSRLAEPAPLPADTLERAGPRPRGSGSPANADPEAGGGDPVGGYRRGIRGLGSRPAERRRQELPFLRECYELLVSHDVEPKVADHLVADIATKRVPSGYPESSRVRAVVRAQLIKLFVPNPPIDERGKPRTLVLVGPTGVGKTTTIAKLAARAKINERRRVGLITIDTFRIAAVDQLEKYAQIIGLPLIIATNPQELLDSVNEFRAQNIDLIFVDSAGRSPRDELKMAELREFLAVLPDAESHLVVSTTTHGKTMLSVANRFDGVGFHKLILTKVDESISFGSLVAALVAIGRPVSFVTDGQNVPDDIVPSDPERLADLVLKTNAL